MLARLKEPPGAPEAPDAPGGAGKGVTALLPQAATIRAMTLNKTSPSLRFFIEDPLYCFFAGGKLSRQ